MSDLEIERRRVDVTSVVAKHLKGAMVEIMLKLMPAQVLGEPGPAMSEAEVVQLAELVEAAMAEAMTKGIDRVQYGMDRVDVAKKVLEIQEGMRKLRSLRDSKPQGSAN